MAWKVCVECLKFIEAAAEFEEKAKLADCLIQCWTLRRAMPTVSFQPMVENAEIEEVGGDDASSTVSLKSTASSMEWSPGGDQQGYKCKHCSRMFQTEKIFKDHLKVRHNVLPPKKPRASRRRTSNGVDRKPQLNCLICLLHFSDKKGFDEHRQEMHKAADTNTVCGICQKDYEEVRRLRCHVASAHASEFKLVEPKA